MSATPSYNFIPVFIKLCMRICFVHGMKMCMWLEHCNQIIFSPFLTCELIFLYTLFLPLSFCQSHVRIQRGTGGPDHPEKPRKYIGFISHLKSYLDLPSPHPLSPHKNKTKHPPPRPPPQKKKKTT